MLAVPIGINIGLLLYFKYLNFAISNFNAVFHTDYSLEHSIEHYAAGNVKLRVLTGPLAGQEGYLVRMARDRKLVMAIGGMTVAIGNVHKEEFEPVEQSGE